MSHCIGNCYTAKKERRRSSAKDFSHLLDIYAFVFCPVKKVSIRFRFRVCLIFFHLLAARRKVKVKRTKMKRIFNKQRRLWEKPTAWMGIGHNEHICFLTINSNKQPIDAPQHSNIPNIFGFDVYVMSVRASFCLRFLFDDPTVAYDSTKRKKAFLWTVASFMCVSVSMHALFLPFSLCVYLSVDCRMLLLLTVVSLGQKRKRMSLLWRG